MATAPTLVVAGQPYIARKLRETGRFPAVFDVADASGLRDLSQSGRVAPPAAFMFAPGFAEDLPGAGVAVLANGLARNGYTVVVHDHFAQRGDGLDPRVRIAASRLRLADLLAALGVTDPVSTAASGPAPSKARRGRVITVASAKGGVGKTTTAVNLSVFAARLLRGAGRDGSVVLVDTNFQQADVGRYLNLTSPTVLDLLRAPGRLTAETARGRLAQVPEAGLHVLLGPSDVVSADPALINSALYREILAALREAFDYVIVDTPVAELYHITFADLILPESDAILVPVEPNRVTLESAAAWLRAITLPQHSRGGGVDPERLSLILNRARADVECGPEDVMDLMPGWRFVGMIPEDREWMQAANSHRLASLRLSADLETTFCGILQAVTGDPVFATAPQATTAPSLAKRLLGLSSK
jgi:MinD-like ATPase involved in chromosome partitioning or flagellar assembly